MAVLEAAWLAKRHELIIAAHPGPLRSELERHGALIGGPPLLPIWGASRWRWTKQVSRTLVDAVRLAGVIRRHDIAAVVCNSSVAVSPVLAARMTRRPAIVHVRDSPSSRFGRAIVRVQGRLATTVLPIAQGLEALCGERPRARVVRVHDGISCPETVSARPAFRRPVRLAVIAAIDFGKGQDLAVRALHELNRRGVEAELDLVGRTQDAAFGSSLKREAARMGLGDRVAFRGEAADLEAVYSQLDILLVPSRRDWTPLVVMEALARCLPVVGTRVGGIPELLLDGRGGILVDPESPDAIARAVQALVESPKLASELGTQGRRHIIDNYNLKDTLERSQREIERTLHPALRRRG